MSIVAIDDQQMPIGIAAVDVAGPPAFYPVRLRDRLIRDRIERKTPLGAVVHAVAFTEILKLHGLLRHVAADDDVREAVDVDTAGRGGAAEVGVQAARRPDEGDERRRPRINGRRRNIEIPPVVRWEKRQRRRQRPIQRSRLRDQRRAECNGETGGGGEMATTSRSKHTVESARSAPPRAGGTMSNARPPTG